MVEAEVKTLAALEAKVAAAEGEVRLLDFLSLLNHWARH